MKLKITTFAFFLCLSTFCFSQNNTLEGESYRSKNAVLKIYYSFNDKYYNRTPFLDSIKVINGKFKFKRPELDKDIPYPFNFSLERTKQSFYQSDLFFIDNNTKEVIVGKKNDSTNFDVLTKNSVVEKEVSKFKDYYAGQAKEKEDAEKKFNLEFEKYQDQANVPQSLLDRYYANEKLFKEKADSILLEYTIRNPDSFVAMWKLVESFQRNSYKPIYQDTYNSLSKNLKEKQTVKTLKSALEGARIFQKGNLFPTPELKTITGEKIKLEIPNAKYTLVDFWFSHCQPCLKQMPKYIDLYNTYKSKGFEIVGIATDQTISIVNLKNTIKKKQITWKNYWDVDGNQSEGWTITSFPTNFLLDEDGKILDKNIELAELERLLQKL